jgi:hypothetical protein
MMKDCFTITGPNTGLKHIWTTNHLGEGVCVCGLAIEEGWYFDNLKVICITCQTLWRLAQ